MSGTPDDVAWPLELCARLDELIDGYRSSLHASLKGLSEDEARMALVPSATTLLGLVKHATFVEGVWFDKAVTGAGYDEIGIASSPAESFVLSASDTIASVQEAYRAQWEASRRNMAELEPDGVVRGRGRKAVWELKVQVLRELAQHQGHADILREQIIAGRAARRRTGLN